MLREGSQRLGLGVGWEVGFSGQGLRVVVIGVL